MISIPIRDTSFSRVGIDLIGPLPQSASGNKYIVTAIDYLTKWPETKAVPDKEALTIWQFFLEDVVARHGCPDEVLTDNGGEFFGVFDSNLQAMGVDHWLTSPNHPAANGLVEHFNCTFMDSLRKCMKEDPECKLNWDKFLPRILLGYRATMQASTKFSPFYLCYAKPPRMPLDFKDYFSTDTSSAQMPQDITAAPIVKEKEKNLAHAIPAAMENIGKAQEKQRRDYTRKRRYVEPSSFKVGDFCLLRARRSNKLSSKVDSNIYKLVGFTNDSHKTAILSDNSTPPKRWTEHVQNIAPYTNSPQATG